MNQSAVKNEHDIRKEIQELLSPSRFAHCLEVAETAVNLAQRYGFDSHKARLAGLIHDVARDLSGEELLVLAARGGLKPGPDEMKVPVLLHAPAGALLARQLWGISDKDVLAAVENHTLGAPGMGFLEKIIFLADMIAPGRQFPGVGELRRLAAEDLDQAVLMGLEKTIIYVVQQGLLLHPRTVLARNALREALHS